MYLLYTCFFCRVRPGLVNLYIATVTEWEGEVLEIARISRLDMSAYLCIASNGVPPSVSKRIKVSVDCEYWMLMTYLAPFQINRIEFLSVPSIFGGVFFLLHIYYVILFFLSFYFNCSSTDGLDPTAARWHTRWLQCDTRMLHRSISYIVKLLVKG